MSEPTIREQLERWVVEEPTKDGLFRKVPLMDYVERYAAEAVAVERARIAAAVRELVTTAEMRGFGVDTTVSLLSLVDRAAVLAIVEREGGG